MNASDLTILAKATLYLPLAVVVVTAALALLAKPRGLHWAEPVVTVITVVASLALLLISLGMMVSPEKEISFSILGPLLGVDFSVDFRVDALSIFMIVLINVVAFAASWSSIGYMRFENGRQKAEPKKWWEQGIWFHVLINLFHFTMLLVPLADNLIVVWVAIELTTVGSAFLVVHENKKNSWDATWKYLIITSTGIVLALLGTVFLANSLPQALIAEEQSNRLLNWSYLMDHANRLNSQFVWFAFLFAVVGYGTKAGLAPMHTWLPDAHGEAPFPVSALLSGVLLKASLYAVLRFYTLTNAVLGEAQRDWTSYVLLAVGLISLLVATPLILKENPFKRVLAYHSLEHMGIIVFGLGMGGVVAISGAVLHMLNHAITKALMFLAHGNLTKHYQTRPIQGALRLMPWSGGLLTLGGLALVGMPPFNVFMSELIILWGSMSRLFPNQGQGAMYPAYTLPIVVAAVGLFVVSTTLIFFSLTNHLKQLVLGNIKDKTSRVAIPREQFSWTMVAPLLFLAVLMLGLGVWVVPPLANLVSASTRVILNLQG